jgi:hypothetical protein
VNDHERLYAFVERFFARAERTEFPTVRRCARSLGWPLARVEDAVEGDPDGQLFFTYYHVETWPRGDRFVESHGERT